jgi:predicted alpha/beta-hydrolase family hydrolase
MREIRFKVGDEGVSGLLETPKSAHAILAIAHGAGAGMRHRFLADVAKGLASRGVATLRYQFPYMEAGRKRPDPPAKAVAAVRAALAEAERLEPDLPLFAGGKSFGGRMTSTAEAESHMTGVIGLVFLGFPLHAPGKPSTERGDHLKEVRVPMLFLQGTRDSFADNALIKRTCSGLGKRARLVAFAEADHSFHVPKSSGSTDSETLAALIAATADWIGELVGLQRAQ